MTKVLGIPWQEYGTLRAQIPPGEDLDDKDPLAVQLDAAHIKEEALADGNEVIVFLKYVL